MKRAAFLLSLPLLLLGAVSCAPKEDDPVVSKLDFGTLIDTSGDAEITARSQVRWIKASRLANLVRYQSNFLLLVHGSSDTCSCYTGFHHNLATYAKAHDTLIYGIDLDELESGESYYGLKRIAGYDTLAVFKDGKALHQQSTDDQSDPFVSDYDTLSTWISKRTQKAKIFTVNEEILDSYYQGSTPFTVYFGSDQCGDCGYLNRTALRDYLGSHDRIDPHFLYIDFDAFRPTANYTEEPEKWAQQQEAYLRKKAQFGLSQTEANPAGFDAGVYPSVFHINPDGSSYTGDVIEAAGVFYNERIDKTTGELIDVYFTRERYESAKTGYLQYLSPEYGNVNPPYMEGVTLDPNIDKHEQLEPYETPFFNALLDFAVKG